jgi:type II secretory pathway pseudopilin PulG
MQKALKANGARGGERGFSLLQMLIVLAVIITLSGFAVIGIRSARNATRLQNSARTFTSRVEKARLDAIRRHTSTSVEFISPTTYQITMDFLGTGEEQTRTFTLEEGVVLVDADGALVTAEPFPDAVFDWRGRTAECSMLFRMRNTLNETSVVQVAGSGDITINNVATSLPTVTYANVSSTADVSSDAALTGPDMKLNLSPCGTSVMGGIGGTPTPTPTPVGGATPTPTPVATPTPAPPQVTIVLSTNSLSVGKNRRSTGTFSVTVNGAGIIVMEPNSNLSVSPLTRVVTSTTGGTFSFSVVSVNNSRSTFPVRVTFSNADPRTLYVQVTN